MCRGPAFELLLSIVKQSEAIVTRGFERSLAVETEMVGGGCRYARVLEDGTFA